MFSVALFYKKLTLINKKCKEPHYGEDTAGKYR